MLFARVGLRDISDDPVATLARRIDEAIPIAWRDAVALVDSPRWPRDLDWSSPEIRPRPTVDTNRNIDRRLRAAIKLIAASQESRTLARFAMFPTPPLAYFARCVRGDSKPHLRAFADALFGKALDGCAPDGAAVSGGAIFTRFMLSGFAAYRALDSLGARTYECYPDLQFRLWACDTLLPSKREAKRALAVRRQILMRMARDSGIEFDTPVRTMDQADAAILSLGAVAAQDNGNIMVFEEPAEGNFLLAIGKPDTKIRSLFG